MSFIICSSPFGSWSSRPQPCDSDHRYRDSGEIYYYNHHINWISSFVKIMTNIETRKSTWSQRIISDNCAVVASQGFTTSIITNKDVHRIGQSDWAIKFNPKLWIGLKKVLHWIQIEIFSIQRFWITLQIEHISISEICESKTYYI